MAFEFFQMNSCTIPECEEHGKVLSVSIGGVVVWSAIPLPTETLLAPTISLDDSLLTMSTTDTRTEEFVVIVDGEEKATVSAIEYTSGMAYKLVEGENGEMSYTCVGIGDATGSINIPYTIDDIPVTEIDKMAFYKAEILSVAIHKEIKVIGTSAVSWSPTLQKVVINGTPIIGEGAFGNNYNLHTVNLNDDITELPDAIFISCRSLKSMKIPSAVTSIGTQAFWDCGLEEVTIPDKVLSIGNYAFAYCSKLAQIKYTGIMAQWNAIEKGTDWNRSVPAMHVRCADGDVEL